MPDVLAQSLVSISSSNGSIGVSSDLKIKLTFNEPIQRGTGSVIVNSEAIQRGSGDRVLKSAAGLTIATYPQVSSYVTLSGNTLTINSTLDLDYGTEYKVEFAAESVQDSAENNFTETNRFDFMTESSANTAAIAGAILMSTSKDVTLVGRLTATGNCSSTSNYLKFSNAKYINLE